MMEVTDVLWKTRLIILSAVLFNIVCTIATSMHYERQTFLAEISPSYDIIFTTSQPSDITCAWSCHHSDGCVGFFYNKDSGACVGTKEPCQVSTSTNDDETDMYGCWTMAVGTGTSPPPRDCLDVLSRNQSAEDGVYSITTVAGTEVDVYCVMSKRGGGWTVLLRRYNGEVLFNRTFLEYDEGFGDKAGEHWLGLRYIHEMTASDPSDLHIYSSGIRVFSIESEVYEEWSDFSVGPGPNYTLHVGSLLIWAYDSEYHPPAAFNKTAGYGFSTMDVTRDSCQTLPPCSETRGHGGFWFMCCSYINPTGVYVQPTTNGEHTMHNAMFFASNSIKKMKLMYRRATTE